MLRNKILSELFLSAVTPHVQEVAVEQTRNAYRVWWGKTEGKSPREGSRRIDKDNIKGFPKKQDGMAGVKFTWRWLGTRRWREGLL